MNIKEFKDFFEKFEKGTVFPIGISKPFSWRGSYDEVCFSFLEEEMTKEEIVSRIDLSMVGKFIGWKGGEYEYNEWTSVNFEESQRDYTDKSYILDMLFKFIFTPKTT